MEGTSRLITWRNATEVLDAFTIQFIDVMNSTSDTTVLAETIGNIAYGKEGLYERVQADAFKFDVTQFIANLNSTTDKTSEAALYAVSEIEATFINAILSYFKIKAPRKVSKGLDSFNGDPYFVLESAIKVQDLVMVYFFVAAGMTLIIMGLQIALAKKGKCAGDYAAIGLRLVVGTALALVSLVTVNFDTQQHFLYSPWMLPTVCSGIIILVVVDAVLGYLLPAPKELIAAHEHHHAAPVDQGNRV